MRQRSFFHASREFFSAHKEDSFGVFYRKNLLLPEKETFLEKRGEKQAHGALRNVNNDINITKCIYFMRETGFFARKILFLLNKP